MVLVVVGDVAGQPTDGQLVGMQSEDDGLVHGQELVEIPSFWL